MWKLLWYSNFSFCKVLLKPGYTHLFMYCLWLVSHCKVKLSSCKRPDGLNASKVYYLNLSKSMLTLRWDSLLHVPGIVIKAYLVFMSFTFHKTLWDRSSIMFIFSTVQGSWDRERWHNLEKVSELVSGGARIQNSLVPDQSSLLAIWTHSIFK